MSRIRDKMKFLQDEIDNFIKDHPNVTPTNFPFREYKLLNDKLMELYKEMGSSDTDIHIKEGTEWFREQIDKLVNFLPT